MITPLRVAVQKNGRLFAESADILAKCAFKLGDTKRSYRHRFDDFPLEVLLVRDDDICGFVHTGICDLGIVGYNEVHEFESQLADDQTKLHTEQPLNFSHCRLCLAIPHDCSYDGLSWFDQKKIATSYPESLKRFLEQSQIQAEIISISGSVETMPSMGVADAVCDLVATGSSLSQHDLKEVHTLLSSEAVLVSSADSSLSCDARRTLIHRFCQRVRGVLKAQRSKYVMMNAPYGQLAAIKKIIPGMQEPTVMPLLSSQQQTHQSLSAEDTVAVHVVATEPVFWSTIEKLTSLGAKSVLVVPIEKIID